jgi:hypothetical protein
MPARIPDPQNCSSKVEGEKLGVVIHARNLNTWEARRSQNQGQPGLCIVSKKGRKETKEEIRTFLEKQRLREFIITRPSLQKLLQEFL